ncbi:MAG: phosphoenolpyruvate carboxylase [Steroidobacteraceae bacterium]
MDRHLIKFPEKHLALREDVHQLGVLVGDVLREQGGEGLYDLVEGDRVTAIGHRQTREQADGSLMLRIAGRPPEQARDLVRAFSIWFQTVNLAERVHRIRRRREYFLAGDRRPQPGGIEDCLLQFKARGLGLEQVLELIGSLAIEPILISHPTESTRRTQLRRQQRMARTLLDRLNPNLDPVERRHLWERLRTEITTGWQTEEHPRQRLTVADEREHAMFYFAEVLYRIVPAFYEEIAVTLEQLYGACVSVLDLPTVVRFGSWVGGDMEDAPEVNAKAIRETLDRQHKLIVNAYFSDCQQLSQLLSQSASRVGILPALQRRIDEYTMLLPGVRAVAPSRHDQMPYRMFFAQIAERLHQTWDGRASRYERVEQLRADLQLAASSLLANRGASAGYQLVQRLLVRVDTFGFHMATLDLRQHARVHHRVLAQGLDDPQWPKRPAQERLERLAAILARDEGPAAPLDALGRRTLAVFETALQCRSRYGKRAIGNYIIGATSGAEDVLAPLVLARWAGTENRSFDEANLDYAPLFESAESLAASGDTLRTLLDNPHYAAHLTARGGPQTVFIGYSQGSRDSGFIATRLSAFKAQREITRTMRAAGRSYVIARARGGSVARGGSRIDALVRAAPPESVNGVLRLTEQGETISQNYGLRPTALRTLERAFGALASVTLTRQQGDMKMESEAALACVEWLAARSCSLWRERMVADRDFADFFRAVTPIDVIERMQVGSRSIWEPDAGGTSLAVRPAPWVFAWSQARWFAPGWYGAGTALEEARGHFGIDLLRSMGAEWPFFTLLLDDLESQLARVDVGIAGQYVELATPGLRHYAADLVAEYRRCRAVVLEIRQTAELLDGDTMQQRAIQLRNPYVDPMNLMQVDLLRRWRATGREDQDLFQALLASVSGIAQGLQTTG